MHAPTEKRSSPRRALSLSCKVHHPRTARYYPALLANASTCGALVEIRWPNSLSVGDDLHVSLSGREAPVVTDSALVPATVVRVRHENGLTLAGVRFARAVALPGYPVARAA